MPGLVNENLSSNWKILQQRLNAGKAQQAEAHGVKRKRSETTNAPPAKHERARHGLSKFKTKHEGPWDKRRKMGGNISKDSAEAVASSAKSTPRTSLSHPGPAAPLPIPPVDLTPATLVNQGLHPTHKPGKFLALDCEMVGTGPPPHSDSVLARVSVVNYHGLQIYDSYVQAPRGIAITDYRTFVSGIKPEHMSADVARPFAEVQSAVAGLLKDRVLVGHALKNDMAALMLAHPLRDTRDTAKYAEFRKLSMGKAPALRRLAKEFLGLDIQSGEHSSVEDARATMALFKKEKEGFEREARLRFGTSSGPRRLQARATEVNGPRSRAAAVDQSSDEEDDLDEDDDDEGSAAEDVEDGTGKKSKPKKKRKKKKRTKRL